MNKKPARPKTCEKTSCPLRENKVKIEVRKKLLVHVERGFTFTGRKNILIFDAYRSKSPTQLMKTHPHTSTINGLAQAPVAAAVAKKNPLIYTDSRQPRNKKKFRQTFSSHMDTRAARAPACE